MSYQALLKDILRYTARAGDDCTSLERAISMLASIELQVKHAQLLNNIEGLPGDVSSLGQLIRHVRLCWHCGLLCLSVYLSMSVCEKLRICPVIPTALSNSCETCKNLLWWLLPVLCICPFLYAYWSFAWEPLKKLNLILLATDFHGYLFAIDDFFSCVCELRILFICLVVLDEPLSSHEEKDPPPKKTHSPPHPPSYQSVFTKQKHTFPSSEKCFHTNINWVLLAPLLCWWSKLFHHKKMLNHHFTDIKKEKEILFCLKKYSFSSFSLFSINLTHSIVTNCCCFDDCRMTWSCGTVTQARLEERSDTCFCSEARWSSLKGRKATSHLSGRLLSTRAQWRWAVFSEHCSCLKGLLFFYVWLVF